MANTYTLIQSVTVGSGGAASIEFGSIPQTYTDLLVKLSTRSNSADASNGYYFDVFFNNVSANRSGRYLQGNASGAPTAVSGTYSSWGLSASSDFTASVFSSNELYIPNYAGSTFKSSSLDGVQENNATLSRLLLQASLWSDTAAITSVKFTAAAGVFVQYSSASLYGIKNS